MAYVAKYYERDADGYKICGVCGKSIKDSQQQCKEWFDRCNRHEVRREYVILDGVEEESFSEIGSNSLKFSPDSKRFVYSAVKPGKGGGFKYVVEFGVKEENHYLLGPEYLYKGGIEINFSPDSKTISYIGWENGPYSNVCMVIDGKALTLEKLNSSVYSCAELLEEEYESHMKLGKVNEVIIGGYYSGLIAAHSAINENLVPLLKSILPARAEHKLDNIKISQDLVGKEFGEVIEQMRREKNTLPIGVKTATGALLINPGNYIIQQGDCIVGLVSKS